MELRQVRTVIDVRRGFLMQILLGCAAVMVLSGVICSNVLPENISMVMFATISFAAFIITLSMFYDIYINSTYRIFLIGDDIYIYYPTYSTRAGNEFIFYKVIDVNKLKLKGSSIVFTGHVMTKSEGVRRPEMFRHENVEGIFKEVFDEHEYKIEKFFRISRIFADEDKLMQALKNKRK